MLMTVVFTSCVTQKKAERYYRQHPVKLAKMCLDCFPVKPVEFIKGDTVVLVDSILKIDSVEVDVTADCPDGTTVVTKCPPNKTTTIVKHTHSTDTVKLLDTALQTVYNDTLKELKQAEKYKQYFYMLIAVISFILLFIIVIKKALR